MEVFAENFSAFFDHRNLLASLQARIDADADTRQWRGADAMLAKLGADMLHAAAGDHGALAIRWNSDATFHMATGVVCRAFSGHLPVHCLIYAAILGRRDLRDRFMQRGEFCIEAGLQWFVLHGIGEHKLWHIVTSEFLRALRNPTVVTRHGVMPPLALIVLQERPELARLFLPKGKWRADAFAKWMRDEGIADYQLFWAVPAADLPPWQKQPRARGDSAGAASTASELMLQENAALLAQVESGLDWYQTRFQYWAGHGRPFVCVEFNAFSHPCRLLLDSSYATARGGWVRMPASGFSLALPNRPRQAPYVMIELDAIEADGPLSVEAYLDGTRLPAQLRSFGRSATIEARLPATAGSEAHFSLLNLKVHDSESRLPACELIRAWNI